MVANTPTYLILARLIAAGTNTVPALSKARNVSRTRTRAVLTFMRKQRFVESRHGNGLTRYTLAVSIERIEDHARAQQKSAEGAGKCRCFGWRWGCRCRWG